MGIARYIMISASLISTIFPLAATFAQNLTFGLRPEDPNIGYFEYTLNPGDIIKDAVLVVNGAEVDQRLIVAVVAGHTALRGGISFPGEADGPAQWIELQGEGLVEVPAKLALKLPFTLTVPDATPPGEYVAGFLVTPEATSASRDIDRTGGALSVQVVPQMGLSIIINVPGPRRCEVTVDSISSEMKKGEWKVVVHMKNTGNIHFSGRGELRLTPSSGKEPSQRKEFNLGYFIPGDMVNYPLYFDGIPPAGEYSAETVLIGEACSFETVFSQTLTITSQQANTAREEAERWDNASASTDEKTAKQLAAAEMIRSMGFLLLGLAMLFAVVFAICFVLKKERKKDRAP